MAGERKWVVLCYVIITLLLAWVLDHVLVLGLGLARIPNPKMLNVIRSSSLVSLVVMSLAAWFYFGQEKVNTFSAEVAGELGKVTWPARKTVYLSTIVVIIGVVIVASILGIFDWVCVKVINWVLSA